MRPQTARLIGTRGLKTWPPIQRNTLQSHILGRGCLAAVTARFRVPVAHYDNGKPKSRPFGTAAPQAKAVSSKTCSEEISSAPQTGRKMQQAVMDLLIQEKMYENAKQETEKFVRHGYEKIVGKWLMATGLLTVGVICLGGYTRLTVAGLSMTDWRPQGKMLPLTDDGWKREFAAYKETLEYKHVHHDIDMDGFKFIYFNEWFHRMAARATGLFFLGGVAWFGLVRRVFTRPMFMRVGILSALFGLQGVIGWWMVKSGFEERKEEVKTPRVSPYRLVTHLTAGAALYLAFLATALRLLLPPSRMHFTLCGAEAAMRARTLSTALLPLAAVAFVSGAFVAGNDGGYDFNTWPKMYDRWIPEEVLNVTRKWRSIFENVAVVQFNHRVVAYATAVSMGAWFLYVRKLPVSRIVRNSAHLCAQAASLQILLGIAMLLTAVPVSLGVLHQFLGLGVLSAAALSAHTLRSPIWISEARKIAKSLR